MPKEIIVKTGELAVDHNDTIIKTGSIGSCLVIVLYDEEIKIGGMAHAMLPVCRNKDKKGICLDGSEARYVDMAIDHMVKKILDQGGKAENLIAKLVGGASMFEKLGSSAKGIGERNIEVARERLEKMGIRIKGEDTGGKAGKIAEFNLANGVLDITTKL